MQVHPETNSRLLVFGEGNISTASRETDTVQKETQCLFTGGYAEPYELESRCPPNRAIGESNFLLSVSLLPMFSADQPATPGGFEVSRFGNINGEVFAVILGRLDRPEESYVVYMYMYPICSIYGLFTYMHHEFEVTCRYILQSLLCSWVLKKLGLEGHS